MADRRSRSIRPWCKDWLARWEKNILGDARNRYCDREMGEEIGWLVSPFLNGFYYGYLATHDPKWVELLVDWADSWIKRGVKEPDGFIGWPKSGAGGSAGGELSHRQPAGRGDGIAPVVLMAARNPEDAGAEGKVWRRAQRPGSTLAEQIFEKWDPRGCWREVQDGRLVGRARLRHRREDGQMDRGYARRATDGFSHPDNKQNLIARWLLAMHDATRKPVYRERAEKWWRLMKSRMQNTGGRQVLRLELLGPGRAVGLQARWLDEALGRRASQRRLLRDRRGRHRGRLRARPGLHARRPGAAHRHEPRLHVEPADQRRQVPADRRRPARRALERLARRAVDGPGPA